MDGVDEHHEAGVGVLYVRARLARILGGRRARTCPQIGAREQGEDSFVKLVEHGEDGLEPASRVDENGAECRLETVAERLGRIPRPRQVSRDDRLPLESLGLSSGDQHCVLEERCGVENGPVKSQYTHGEEGERWVRNEKGAKES